MFWPDLGISSIDQELRRIRREINSVYNKFGMQTERAFPAVNAYSDTDEILVTSELPGVTLDGIDISVQGNTLGIMVTRKPDEAGKGEKYHRRERWYGKFGRTLNIPFPIDADKVMARYSKGVLYLTLSKAESAKPRKIQVEAA